VDNIKKKKIILLAVNGAIFVIIIAFFVLPDLWVVFASLEKDASLDFVLPTLENLTFANYTGIFQLISIPLLNSLYICGMGTLITVTQSMHFSFKNS
jgi:ABC-type spermidine/putrescine transport system permease subunit II